MLRKMPSLILWILATSLQSCSHGSSCFNIHRLLWVKHCWHTNIPTQVLLMKPVMYLWSLSKSETESVPWVHVPFWRFYMHCNHDILNILDYVACSEGMDVHGQILFKNIPKRCKTLVQYHSYSQYKNIIAIPELCERNTFCLMFTTY